MCSQSATSRRSLTFLKNQSTLANSKVSQRCVKAITPERKAKSPTKCLKKFYRKFTSSTGITSTSNISITHWCVSFGKTPTQMILTNKECIRRVTEPMQTKGVLYGRVLRVLTKCTPRETNASKLSKIQLTLSRTTSCH